MQTQLLEEQLKQVGLTEDMRNVPLRKSVEAAAATTALRKEESQQRQLEKQVQDAERAYEAEQAAAREAARAARNQKVAAEKAAAQPPRNEPVVHAPPAVRLVSVVSVGTQRSAVLAVGDATLIVHDGEQTSGGPVEVVNASTVRVGGKTLHVESMTLSRAVLPDRAPAAEGAAASALAPVSLPTPVAPPQGLPPLLPPQANAAPGASANAMPALQLPPGVRLLQR